MTLPLEGVRVLDLSRLIAGNMLTMLLADFGADVIKVEQPGVGDTLRGWLVADQALYWQEYGRNKRSITLDLKSPLGREVLLRLADGADVLVESFRPGTLERLGLGWSVLHARRPGLVCVLISGWGLTGSLADRPGFGTLVEAKSGYAAMNGFPDREPVLPPIALADMTAGLYGAYAAMLALRHAELSGSGQLVDLSLFESLYSLMGPVAAVFDATGEAPARTGNRSPTSAPRNIYRTGDERWLAISATTQAMFRRLATAIDRPDMLTDERFVDNAARLRNIDELDEAITTHLAARTLAAGLAELTAAGVTATAVEDIAGLVDSDYFASRRVLVHGPTRDGTAGIRMHEVVPRLSATPGAVRIPAPDLGQHNEELIRPLVTDAEWRQLS